MNNIFNQVMKSNNTKGLVEVDKLIENSGLHPDVRGRLLSEGYDLSNLSDRQVSILFFSLVDILFIVKDDNFYLATLCTDKIFELKSLGRLIPHGNEQRFEKTSQLLRSNTKDVINNFIRDNKFHFFKLNQWKDCATSFTLVSLSGMNPYPSLTDDKVYCLTNISDWYSEIYDHLLRGSYKLYMDNGFELCTSYLQKNKGVCTGGYILTNDLSYNPKQVPVWKIYGYEPYSENDFVCSLLRGVVEYDGIKITLNREVLINYYGRQQYLKLESKGVRYKLCLEELLSSKDKFSVAWYINKYNLDTYGCETIQDLQSVLRSKIKSDKVKENIVSARVLCSYDSIVEGHRSYYKAINLDKLDKSKIKVIENVSDVLPQVYDYYNISSGFGYNKVQVKATSEALALKYGETEFKRQYGEPMHFCSLVKDGVVVKGLPVFNMNINIQRHLCQGIMWGYSQNYEQYSQDIKSICELNNIQVTDEYIQFLYVNNLAREHKFAGNVPLTLVIEHLIEFLDTIKVRVDAEKALVKELEKIVYPRVVKEYSMISDNIDDFQRKYTKDGTYIETPNAKYKVGKNNKLNKTVELYFRGRFLCSRIIRS